MRRKMETPTTSPQLVLAALRANRTMARSIVSFLQYAGSRGPHETVQLALEDLRAIFDDTEWLLMEAFRGVSDLDLD